MFLSRNCQLIVAPQKFDVLKTNICPRSETSEANLLGLPRASLKIISNWKPIGIVQCSMPSGSITALLTKSCDKSLMAESKGNFIFCCAIYFYLLQSQVIEVF